MESVSQSSKSGVRLFSALGAWFGEARNTILFVIGFLLFWEIAVVVFRIPRYILPSLSSIIRQFIRNFDLIWEYTLITGYETLVGFVIAVAIGVPLAMLTAFSRLLRQTFYPFAVALEMVPKIAFAPLFVTWFGFGFIPKMIIVFLVCFFPILLNGILGFTSLSQEMVYFSRSTGASQLRMFWKIRLPAALPELFVGLKGAAVNATVGATISEWIGGDAGLGYYIQIATGQLRMDLAFAIIFMLTALGLLLFYIVQLVEKRMIPWHVSQRVSVFGKREL
ncbi:MAG: Hydroxymethylpyrimidine ABC transporter, transmembrane component [Anaerolineae bacterium]|jgi:NitT/TauT family transport system permease protein|nr:MAG: Hydroxymethylpyrimidine ABC transporter, transmembrane component [Anaerolineae bacterium]